MEINLNDIPNLNIDMGFIPHNNVPQGYRTTYFIMNKLPPNPETPQSSNYYW